MSDFFNSASSLPISFLPYSLGSHLSFEAALQFLVFWTVTIRMCWRQSNELVWLVITCPFFVVLGIQYLYFLHLHCNIFLLASLVISAKLLHSMLIVSLSLLASASIRLDQLSFCRKSWCCSSILLPSSVSTLSKGFGRSKTGLY